jgi:hypothetical protein
MRGKDKKETKKKLRRWILEGEKQEQLSFFFGSSPDGKY